jgi:hemolysin D
VRQDDRELLPFLPSAIEVLRTPPPTASRVLVWTIALVFATAMVWACFAKVDTVVMAAGELVPDGQLKLVQPSRTGTVAVLHVSDGQTVKAGDLLLTLDTHEIDAQHASVVATMDRARSARTRATALSAAAQRIAPSAPPALDRLSSGQPNLSARQWGEWSAYWATSAGLKAQAALARANRLKAGHALAKTTALLPLIREREVALAHLLAKSAVARPEWLRAKEALTSLSHDQQIRTAELVEAEKSVLVRTQALEEHRSHARATWLRELDEADKHIEQLHHELARLAVLRRQSELRASVSGTVAQISVHTVGGVVTTASELMRIVPEGVRLSAEIQVSDRDIGFIKRTNAAAVKLDGFPFMRHGALAAQIIRIANVSTSDTQTHGTFFLVKLALPQQHMYVGGQAVALASGMRLSADIKTGQRHVIEFLLEPVIRGFNEALRER